MKLIVELHNIIFYCNRYNFYLHSSNRRFLSDSKSDFDADHWGNFGTLDGALCHHGEISLKQNILI